MNNGEIDIFREEIYFSYEQTYDSSKIMNDY